ESTAVRDANQAHGKEVATQYRVQFYEDLHTLSKSDIEEVIVCSENASHNEHELMAVKHKKHIVCEKALASEIYDENEMIEACEVNDVILQVAYPVRFIPAVKKAKEMIEEGKIGEVIAVNATNHGLMPGGWFVEKELSGGGSATDHIVHIM